MLGQLRGARCRGTGVEAGEGVEIPSGLGERHLDVIAAAVASATLERDLDEECGEIAGRVVERVPRHRVRCAIPQEIGRAHAELQSLMRISYAVFCLKKK